MKNSIKTPYKLCKVYIGPNEAFVQYYWFDRVSGKYKREKIRLNQRGLNAEEKRRELEYVAHEFNKVLRDRNSKWQYHELFISEDDVSINSSTNIPSALLVVKNFEDDKISEDRKESLGQTAKILELFLKEKSYRAMATLNISQLSDKFLELFVKYCKAEGKAGKTINKYLSVIQFATEYLSRKKAIEKPFSTAHLRVAQPKNESGRFPPLTHEEKLKVFEYFKQKDPNYRLYLFFMYYTCIRGAELYRLQRKNIDFEKKTIFIPWFSSKNGLSNYVQILTPLFELLKDLNIDKLDDDTYIFGARFFPSKTPYSGNQSSEKWLNHRKNIGLPKEKQAYGLKHTFNVDYVENNKYNIDWEWLRRHNRHATVQQTQQYISGLTAYFIDETKMVILNYI